MSDENFEGSNEEAPGERAHDTPPFPAPGVTPTTPGTPVGSYALGALAGNPRLGAPSGLGAGYSGPPTDPALPSWAPPPPPGPPQSGSRSLRKGLLITGAAVIAVAAGVGFGHAVWTNNAKPLPTASAKSPARSPLGSGSSGSNGFSFGQGGAGFGSSGSPSSSGPSDVSAIAAKVDPGLVDIDTTLGYAQEQAAGTGIVLTPNGEILTNNHVIEGATTISVTDVGNGQTYSASVVGYDRDQDIAVLQLHSASGLTAATIGNSSNVAVGQDVVGIGNAGGTGGTPSAAGGTVTALNQSITASDEGDSSSEQLTGLIETNADIQAGDSGGSLVNTSGQVVGMDTAASAGFSFQSPNGSSGNQGYSIPINEALSIAKQIESGDSSSKIHIGATAFLGVEVETTSSGGNGYNGGGSTSPGAEVFSAITSSPAQEAGLAQGDVITAVNGQTVDSPEGLTDLLEPFHPGDTVKISWTDTSGQSHTVNVQLTSGPPQ